MMKVTIKSSVSSIQHVNGTSYGCIFWNNLSLKNWL